MTQNKSPERVRTNVRIVVDLVNKDGTTERMTFVIVNKEASDFEQGFLASTAPLASAILGKRVGSRVPYDMGDVRAVHILRVETERVGGAENAAAERRATVTDAVRKAQQTSAEMFASSFSGKWGDYDPDGVGTADEADADEAGSDDDSERA